MRCLKAIQSMYRFSRKYRATSSFGSGPESGFLFVLLLLGLSYGSAWSQEVMPAPRDSLIEQGRFQLFWAQRLAGTETYVVRLTADTLTLESAWDAASAGTGLLEGRS